MQHVLLIEDSADFAQLIEWTLESPEIEVTTATGLDDARTIIERSKAGLSSVDLILLDLTLPDGNGLAFLHELQSNDKLNEVPVFLLTAKEELTSKVAAFSMGAEDYLVKPISPIELKARVEMRLRKSIHKQKKTEELRKGNLLLKPALLKAQLHEENGDEPVELTAKEFKILYFLAKNEGTAFSREELVRSVWGEDVHVLSRTVDSHVYGVRKKLRHLAHYIEAVPGVGYRFQVDSFQSK